ncbi:ARF-binding protein [Malassezia nana]|uniref:ARF-binding protein n=1 Tax=Malassezia nana TaxID=180528 RepID=A0AAF0EIS0_9BASI|nr:ARF-binding protein [Malassezia nana]
MPPYATRQNEWGSRAPDMSVRLTPAQSFVVRCCDPGLDQPNLPLALELADYINTKRANTAREAAFEIVEHVNSRIPHVGLLALHLLDILVKNCGFPMHLQIATKEFLNELVRRFPERPPMHPSPVMTRILEMIHEWRQTICVTSKHKEDLVHIRDMHRLLMYKGYRFPKVDARSVSMLNSAQPLQSPEELEEETRLAQSAKLQELIRRGTPRDLEQAQELMKILSGAEPEQHSVQVRQVAKEMDKIAARAKLLEDMLAQAKPTEKFVTGDAYDQVASHLRSVQPRLQRWIEQAQEEESEHLARFLEINDRIHTSLGQYEAIAHGRAAPGNTTELISFDDEMEAPRNPPAARSGSNDLAALLALDTSTSAPAPTTAPTTTTATATTSATTSAAATAPPTANRGVMDLLGDLDALDSPVMPPLPHAGHAPRPPPASAPHDPFAGLDLLK